MIRWLPLLASAALLAAGCAQQVVRPTVDPFLGDIPGAGKETARDPDKDFVGRPADPPVGTPASTAEITAGPAGVSIGSPRTAEPKAKEPDSKSSLTPAPPPGAGAPLEQVSAQGTPPEPAVPTYESLQKALRERGVSWQQLQCTGNDRWHFICAIPDPTTPGVRENFEVTRTGNMGLNAIQAVVEQIDRERSTPSPQAFQR